MFPFGQKFRTIAGTNVPIPAAFVIQPHTFTSDKAQERQGKALFPTLKKYRHDSASFLISIN